ncbi:GNAT family N-acetyltransferase [Sphingomonas sp. BIUV-7]|uniref:GNAT family N-acetyltransferase n=1 Tax=Sphingomonas natans TaxID=3063330 RepID=A0ABT8Y6M8_9SPHN|nr:GNAT family N-acetyltransferase [Sphingomonas sp. BIUV-7]MDO6413972.1 GNAT family N-acetyltransferase [Sphingomonas sp. BIUV-7]
MFAITERLLLRPGWIEDAPALSRAIGDHAVVRNLARAPWPYALGDAEHFLAMPQRHDRPHMLIFRREGATPELIGGIGLSDGVNDTPELGYWLARAHWGRGYATEAGRALIAACDETLRLPHLIAAHALDNPASGRVLAKLGFRPTGEIGRMHSLGRGGEMDVRGLIRPRFARGEAVADEQAAPLAA